MREIGDNAFTDCENLKTVWLEEGCALDIKKCVDDEAAVLSVKTTVGKQSLRDLRKQKDVAISEGVSKIGE